MAKKTSSKWPVILASLFLLWLLGKNPEHTFGILLLGIAAIYFGNKWLKKSGKTESSESKNEPQVPKVTVTVTTKPGPTPTVVRPPAIRPSTSSESSNSTPSAAGFRIPPAPKMASTPGKWIPAGESVEIQGMAIPGGMVYVGTYLPATHGAPDPALIDPTKNIAKSASYIERHTNYWPSYSDATPQARGAYLNWLAGGKNNPSADIGYVFMYFYGLERRMLIDAVKDNVAALERPQIIEEIKRLLSIYKEKSGSFSGYASRLLNYLELSEHPVKLYEKPIPELAYTGELPYYLRLAIGQAAIDGMPVPAHVAIAWAHNDPAVTLRTAATRCKEEFQALFVSKYHQMFGDGIKISANRTKLKFAYNPASAGLRDIGSTNLNFGDVPDITALTAPVKKLQSVVDACTEALDSFSRFIGRNPEKKDTLDALLQLPVIVWPNKAKESIRRLKEQIGATSAAFKVSELASTFGEPISFTRDSLRGLARALESERIGMEPDVLNISKTLKPDDTIVLFEADPIAPELKASPVYQAALVTLQLAASVAHADGDFSESEVSILEKQVDSWSHLTVNHQRRLRAYIQLLRVEPVSLTSLKKKIEPLDAAAREAIARLAAVMAQADGTVAHEEIQLLEKIYKLLGVDQQKVYSNVHASATTDNLPSQGTGRSSGFTLDTAKIAALQEDSAKISTLLGSIFNEDMEQETQVHVPALVEEDAPKDNGILGLDAPHSAFARILISRPNWSRSELDDVAKDLEIMLDGALERLNEATLDAYDIACTDGEDPIEINPEIIEKLTS